MNKIYCSFFFVLFLQYFNLLQASCERPMTFEVRTAAYVHYSDRFQSIYGRAGPNIQIEASGQAFNCMHVWANSGWSYQDGKSVGMHCRTRAYIADISMGVKLGYYFRERCMSYVGIGPSFARIWVKNKSNGNSTNISKDSIGGTVKIGLHYLIRHNVFLDLFADYIYQPVRFNKRIEMGGLKTGLGIGLNF